MLVVRMDISSSMGPAQPHVLPSTMEISLPTNVRPAVLLVQIVPLPQPASHVSVLTSCSMVSVSQVVLHLTMLTIPPISAYRAT